MGNEKAGTHWEEDSSRPESGSDTQSLFFLAPTEIKTKPFVSKFNSLKVSNKKSSERKERKPKKPPEINRTEPKEAVETLHNVTVVNRTKTNDLNLNYFDELLFSESLNRQG